MTESQRKPQPLLRQSNPGRGVEANFALSEWSKRGAETVNVVDLLDRAYR